MTSVVKNLHGFIQEVNLTEAEWLAGVQFLTAVGQKCDEKRQEFILLSDTLGTTTMKDIINNRKPPGVTEYTILGPFHRLDAPEFPLSGNIADDVPGEPTIVKGRVLSPTGAPIPNARLDVWQSDAEGFYDLQLPDIEGTALRIFHADSDGRYTALIKPAFYPPQTVRWTMLTPMDSILIVLRTFTSLFQPRAISLSQPNSLSKVIPTLIQTIFGVVGGCPICMERFRGG
jgi:protocatechuate 3,4-dioxygenase beta subunit